MFQPGSSTTKGSSSIIIGACALCMLSATNSGHIVRTPGAFWSVDLDIYNFNES